MHSALHEVQAVPEALQAGLHVLRHRLAPRHGSFFCQGISQELRLPHRPPISLHTCSTPSAFCRYPAACSYMGRPAGAADTCLQCKFMHMAILACKSHYCMLQGAGHCSRGLSPAFKLLTVQHLLLMWTFLHSTVSCTCTRHVPCTASM